MIERFTEKAVKVILLAQEEAFIVNHEKLHTEHILLGILREGSGVAAKLLKASGITLEVLREEVRKIPHKMTDSSIASEALQFSPAVKKILREAWYEGQSVGVYYVTPENLFLCLLREENSSIINILRNLDVDVARIKTSVRKVALKSINPNVHPEDSVRITASATLVDYSALTEDEELRKIMQASSGFLQETECGMIGTEQLVMGILSVMQNNSSMLEDVFKPEEISLEKFQNKLEEINSRQDEYSKGEVKFTPKAYDALGKAFDLAREYGSTYIKPEHVLLGILKENNNLAARVFSVLEIDSQELIHKITVPIEREKPEILRIINLAYEEARRMEQNIVGTEQILLGILCEGTGIAASVLRNLGVTLKDVRIEVQKLIGFGHHYSEEKEMVFTPRAKRVLMLAWNKAKQFKSLKVKSEHLLLAITREKESIAMKVLENSGVDVIEIRQGILNEIKRAESAT